VAWHRNVIDKLQATRLFVKVELVGGKVRATIDGNRFLDIHFDPTTHGYSYALIDQSLPYSGDKQLFGWDDFPHVGVDKFRAIKSYPHHFQKRQGEVWVFEESPMRGIVESEIDLVIDYLRIYLSQRRS
jgi:Family of unknown function (DUF6516)